VLQAYSLLPPPRYGSHDQGFLPCPHPVYSALVVGVIKGSDSGGGGSERFDACYKKNPCKNGGSCVSTDNGPTCDCSKTDASGRHCEKEELPTEVTLSGGEYITYDLRRRGFEPILSTNDEISIHFKTRKSNGLLFYTGNGNDHMTISVSDGGVALTVALGTGKLDTRIKPDNIQFNDNKWHHVVVQRQSAEVTLTVDGIYMEHWKTSGIFSILASNTVFLGGSEASSFNSAEDQSESSSSSSTWTNINLVGCLKKVIYKADSLVLNLLNLAQSGNPLLSVIGDLEWRCRDIGPGSPLPYTADENYLTNYYAHQKQQGGVISFTREEAYLVLPSWKSSMSGSISFKFRTIEPNGVLLFNGGTNNGLVVDYFAMELLGGHLYVHLDLGSGAVKIKASRFELNDGSWHRVALMLRKQDGRITIDGDTEPFQTPGEATQLDLGGSLYIGSVDYMDPYLRLPPALWSGTLRYGFVGCLKDFYINGASIDIVQYAHQQDVGSIRSSCHKMPDTCHDRPCMHGGKCVEGWNRYICNCQQTSFSGASCGNTAATFKFSGNTSMSVRYERGVTTEADDVSLRFRSKEQNALLMSSRSDRSQDRLEITLEAGRVRVRVEIGQADEDVYAGHSLNDDVYHTVLFRRRGTKLRVVVDDDDPVYAEVVVSAAGITQTHSGTLMGYSKLYFGGIEPGEIISSQAPGLVGYMEQVSFNGREIFEMVRAGQLGGRMKASNNGARLVESSSPEEAVHHAVSFAAANTYIGLPQMKAYNSINVRFQFRTFEPNGLILFNAGKAMDFIAVELVNGRLHYTLNLGYGPISIKDDTGISLSDNKWHTVSIGRPSRYKQTLMVDGHIAETSNKGDNNHLDLDGILFLGGVRQEMYGNLPRPLQSKSGFQGCISSLETNGELTDPIRHALVPSSFVEEGCEDSVTYEWGRFGGTVNFQYPSDKLPDTKDDVLTLGFITPSLDAVLVRVDSRGGDVHNDYLQVEINGGKLFVNYNLGSKDITFGDLLTKVNDGKYHVVRFMRSDINSTIQVDDNPIQTKFPQGNKFYSKTTVFNDQSLIQMGGRYNSRTRRVDRPFMGVMAGVVYNGLRPLELAANGDPRTQVDPNVKLLPNGIPFDFREKHPHLFTKEALKSMMDRIIESNGRNEDANSFAQNPRDFTNCDDEEDCIAGSGSGDGMMGGGSNSHGTVIGGDSYSDRLGGNGGANDVTGNNNNDVIKDNGASDDLWYNPGGADSRYVPLSTEYPPYVDEDDDEFSNYDTVTTASNNNYEDDDSTWQVLLYPETTNGNGGSTLPPPDLVGAPTLLPLPSPDDSSHGGENEMKGYDDKWNVDDTESGNNQITSKSNSGGSETDGGRSNGDSNPSQEHSESKSMPGTMVLVIGIITGAFVAMILIIIFVLKMKIRVDGSRTVKGDEGVAPAAPRYQFAPPNDYGEIPGGGGNGGVGPGPGGIADGRAAGATATTALMEGQARGPPVHGPGNGPGHNNGFFNNNCGSLAAAAHAAQTANGDRSRLFRKSNGSKPVREWYV